uniref:Uncharacterized protein n=1 Tax=Ditylenchus dipsaci TaxID=166011 RepID=A0A915EKJ2_9BILA
MPGHTAEAKPQNSKNSAIREHEINSFLIAQSKLKQYAYRRKEDGVIRIAWVIPKDATTATDNLTGKECHYFDYPFHTDNKEQVLAGNMELDLETGESFNQIIFPITHKLSWIKTKRPSLPSHLLWILYLNTWISFEIHVNV